MLIIMALLQGVEIKEKFGCIIEFTTEQKVIIKDKFCIIFKDKEHYFEAIDIKVGGKDLIIKAKEVGYWGNYFNRMKDLDLRDLIALEVYPITREEKIAEINQQSGWC